MKVKIPTPLFNYTGHQSSVEATGQNLLEVMASLDHSFPGLRFRVIDEQDKIRPHIKFFVNGRQSFDLNQTVTEKSEIVIVQAFSGG